MRVRMKIQISGSRNGAYWPAAGGEIDLPDREAEKMLAAGTVEAAVAAPVETATVKASPRARSPRA